MPHEKIWDRHNVRALPGEKIAPDQNALIIGWSSGPDPLHDEAPDGWVQLSASRPGLDSRIHLAATGTSPDDVREAVRELAQQKLRGWRGLDRAQIDEIADVFQAELGYAVGPRADQYAIQLDRDGCNRVIRHVRKARDVAYGRDE